MDNKSHLLAAFRMISILTFFAATSFTITLAEADAGIKTTPDHVDLGFVDEGIQAIALFTVENAGDKPLSITNVRTN